VEHDTVWPDVEEGLEQASMQSIPKMQDVGGVGGVTYLRHRFFCKSTQSLSPLGTSLSGLQ